MFPVHWNHQKLLTRDAIVFVHYEEAPDGGYVAFVPALPGCHTQGDRLEETERNVKEASELYLECLSAEGQDAPVERRSFQCRVTVRPDAGLSLDQFLSLL